MTGIGFFAPFPLALMIPFMAGQSLAMGEAFGKGFQYGKRKISSMSNEEFNALDFKGLSESIATDYKDMIPSMERSIRNSDKLQSAVIQEMGDLIKSIPNEILNFFAGLAGEATSTSTSASQLGSIQNIRYAPSHDREADLARTNKAIADAQKALDKIIEEAAHIVKKPPPPKQTFDNKSSNAGILEHTLSQVKNKTFVSPPTAPAILQSRAKLKAEAVILNKPRAPKSICIQIRKYDEEIRIYNEQIKREQSRRTPSRRNIDNFAFLRARRFDSKAKLKKKYNTSTCAEN